MLAIVSPVAADSSQQQNSPLISGGYLVASALEERLSEITSGDLRHQLSRRELQCLTWASEGKTAAETAIILGISDRTTRFYIESARNKLDAVNITQAVTKALRNGIIPNIETGIEKLDLFE